jgi:hypothetical protein
MRSLNCPATATLILETLICGDIVMRGEIDAVHLISVYGTRYPNTFAGC